MTYEEAYQYLDTVSAQFKGTRQDHQHLMEALNLIKELISEKLSTDS